MDASGLLMRPAGFYLVDPQAGNPKHTPCRSLRQGQDDTLRIENIFAQESFGALELPPDKTVFPAGVGLQS
jgi:hypothetical protein